MLRMSLRRSRDWATIVLVSRRGLAFCGDVESGSSSLTKSTDIDWEFPGGDGQDYRQTPNSEKVWEIDAFPLFLQEIKSAIGDAELSIAAPGRVEDMIAYTAENVAQINTIVDYVNVSNSPPSVSATLGFEVN